MAAVVISQLTSALSFLREHPKLSCVLLLLLSSPLYRILLYFTPLLLSTALCIFALITLTPYVTATDAEVERQSLLGASSEPQLKKKTVTATATGTIIKERKLADVSGYDKPSSSVTSLASLPASSPASISISASETSWFSWMKGLNDIGRTWMENKLIEQGLALSEPANRETLLAFIEGSFADLMTPQGNPISDHQLFAAMDNCEDGVTAVTELVHYAEKSGEVLKSSSSECSTCCEEGHVLQTSVEDEEVLCAKVSSMGDDGVPLIENEEEEESDTAAVKATVVDAPSSVDACAVTEEHPHTLHEVKSMQEKSEALLHDVKVQKHRLPAPQESAFPVVDSICDIPGATIMPRTPSRIPAPSKLFEASRKFFSKEEQNRSMVPRAPLQTSATARANQPFRLAVGSTGPSKTEGSQSLFKLPTRKFLDRSRSIPSKEGSKQNSTSTTLEPQAAGSKVVQLKMKENNDSNEAVNVARDAGDGIKDELSVDAGDFASGPGDNGPRFDEDLEVEEAQALVQSELKMLEVELEEVAAKLPKLDETFTYQKTPVRSVTSAVPSLTPGAVPSLTPSGASNKCAAALFSASPTLKTW